MAITITKTDRKDITKLICPDCGKRVGGIGLLKDSRVDGLTFHCNRCSNVWAVKTE